MRRSLLRNIKVASRLMFLGMLLAALVMVVVSWWWAAFHGWVVGPDAGLLIVGDFNGFGHQWLEGLIFHAALIYFPIYFWGECKRLARNSR